LCASHPFLGEPEDLVARFERVVEQSRAWLAPEALQELHIRLAADRRAALASAHVFVGVHADGWAQQSGHVRVRQPKQPLRALRLHCTQDIPGGAGWSHIEVRSPDGQVLATEVSGNGPFDLMLELGDSRPDARLLFDLSFTGGFVPAELGVGSGDRRRLAFRIDSVETYA
jgi:hypothetical protein